MKSQVEIGSSSSEKPLAGAFGHSLAPQKSRLFPTKFLLFFFKKRKEYISEAGPHPKAFQPPHCDEMEGREIRRSRRGALALKSGQGPPGRGIAVRRFSPLRRREGPPPQPPTTRYRQKPPRFTVFCALPIFFPFFGSCGSRWVNMGQHRPQDGPT